MKTYKTTRNWKVLANRMEGMNNLEMIEFLMVEGYQMLQGFEHHLISRAVFVINERIVVKVAKNNCGLEQNWAEQQVYEQLQDHQKKHFAKLYYEQCITGLANFMEKVKPRKGNIKEFNRVYKAGKFKANRVHNKIGLELNITYNEDLRGHHNFGIKNGRLVVLDYGCNMTVKYMYSEARKKHRPRSRWYDKNFGLVEL